MDESKDTVFEEVMRKNAQRKEKQKEIRKNFEESVDKGEKKLVCDVSSTGLYSLRFTGGGNLPDELKGKFTSIDRIRKMVVARYGKDILA
jgi:hypothetical protein